MRIIATTHATPNNAQLPVNFVNLTSQRFLRSLASGLCSNAVRRSQLKVTRFIHCCSSRQFEAARYLDLETNKDRVAQLTKGSQLHGSEFTNLIRLNLISWSTKMLNPLPDLRKRIYSACYKYNLNKIYIYFSYLMIPLY